MAFFNSAVGVLFNSAVGVLQTLVIALGAGLGTVHHQPTHTTQF